MSLPKRFEKMALRELGRGDIDLVFQALEIAWDALKQCHEDDCCCSGNMQKIEELLK